MKMVRTTNNANHRSVLTGLSLFACVLTWATPSVAHHAFAANYDIDSEGRIQGIVEDVFWASPHVHYYVRVTTDEGSALWDVESANLNAMAARGWTRNTIRVGDEIVVSGRLGRDGNRRIWMDRAAWADGSPIE
jgi:hypothetical protein